MKALELVKLNELMNITSGRPEIIISMIDGPVTINHPDLLGANIRGISETNSASCTQSSSFACMHGTSVAGVLCAKRGSMAPAICPNCTLLVRPVFAETVSLQGQMPVATPSELANAIIECIEAGSRVINLSLALSHPSFQEERMLNEALNFALKRGVIIVAAAGNQGTVGSSVITRHPWIISVAACNIHGNPISQSNLGSSIGRQGLRAPGEDIISLSSQEPFRRYGGTSVATPFVTGTIALLWSKFPHASAAEVKLAVTKSRNVKRRSIVPPLLDAMDAYSFLAMTYH